MNSLDQWNQVRLLFVMERKPAATQVILWIRLKSPATVQSIIQFQDTKQYYNNNSLDDALDQEHFKYGDERT